MYTSKRKETLKTLNGYIKSSLTEMKAETLKDIISKIVNRSHPANVSQRVFSFHNKAESVIHLEGLSRIPIPFSLQFQIDKMKGKPEKRLSLIHISEPTRPLYISYAVFCLKKKKKQNNTLKTKSTAIQKSAVTRRYTQPWSN
eukprot:TRINITY_DN61937_c0_g1_i2.p1 TRINITY_DN61937_c0_g1~~TRINITY_DN61937_c0_g1_i2.p1  ORF type:complete len:153 (+),score=34.67 TRINITY_DN61937_c0_g1_i2:31-459(+)